MMERVESYLKRVASALPRAGRDDIVEELREALLSRIEERERATGRQLTDEEVASVLRAFGHPLAIAGGYSHPGGLIPSMLVPFYGRVLAWTIAFIASLHAALGAGRAISDGSVGAAIARSLPGMVVAMLAAFTAITLVFMMLGRLAPAERARATCRPSP
jgi:hypothetical protein